MDKLLKDYRELKGRIDALKKEQDAIRDEIIAIAEHEGIKSGEFGDFKFTLQTRENVKSDNPALVTYLVENGGEQYVKKVLDTASLKKDITSFPVEKQEEVLRLLGDISITNVLTVKEC